MKIAVYNPLSGHGHLDSWHAIFVHTLVKHGQDVVALTPNPTALRDLLDLRGCSEAPNLRVAQITKWRKRPLMQRITRFVARSAKDVVGWVASTLGVVREDPIPAPSTRYLNPVDIAVNVATAYRQRQVPDIVLVMYMDLYQRERSAWRAYDSVTKVPWVGMRFHIAPTARRPEDDWFRSRAFRGLGFLAEDVWSQHIQWFPNKHFVCLPEITTHLTCPDNSTLVATLKARAKGRKIVFYGGSIGRSKNLATWGRVIAAMDPAKWFFCLIGEICRYDLSPEDLAVVECLERKGPENVFAHLQYVGSDCVFNAMIAESDVIYAVYRDFAFSSNLIAKAAWLEKPVVVSDRFLMGQRALRYGIGKVADESDPEGIAFAIEALCRNPPAAESFLACRADCCETVLGERLTAWLGRCVSG